MKPNVIIIMSEKNVIVSKHRWHFRHNSPLDTKHRTEERRRKEQLNEGEPPRNCRARKVPRCHTFYKSSAAILNPLFQTVLSLLIFALAISLAGANTPPRFLIDGGGTAVGGDVIVKLKEGLDTPVGTKILQLRGYDRDGDNLEFGVKDDLGIIAIENGRNNQAGVYLTSELDAESRTEYEIVLTLTDGHLGEGNFITQSMLVLVEDTNDNAPVFRPYPNTVSVQEHSGPKVIASLEATDRDAGIFGQVIYDLREQSGHDDLFSITTANGRGVISVTRDLDYETKPVYQLEILAHDRSNFGRVNTATAAILVKVEDISDQPPEFVTVPSVTRIPESVPRFAEVGTVSFALKCFESKRESDKFHFLFARLLHPGWCQHFACYLSLLPASLDASFSPTRPDLRTFCESYFLFILLLSLHE